jgi:hypothetical protein
MTDTTSHASIDPNACTCGLTFDTAPAFRAHVAKHRRRAANRAKAAAEVAAINGRPYTLTVFNAVNVPQSVQRRVMELLGAYDPDIYQRECDASGRAYGVGYDAPTDADMEAAARYGEPDA